MSKYEQTQEHREGVARENAKADVERRLGIAWEAIRGEIDRLARMGAISPADEWDVIRLYVRGDMLDDARADALIRIIQQGRAAASK